MNSLGLRKQLEPGFTKTVNDATSAALTQDMLRMEAEASNPIVRGFEAAGLGMRGNALYGQVNEAELAGDRMRAQELERAAQDAMQQSQVWAPTTRNFTDINGLGSALEWTGAQIGNLHTSIPPVVGGLAGAAVGLGVGALTRNPGLGARAGSAIGAFVPGYMMERDEAIGQAMQDEAIRSSRSAEEIRDAANVKGVLAGAAEAVVPFGVANSVLLGGGKKLAADLAKDGAAKTIGKRSAVDAGTEFLTEGAQSLIGQGAQNHLRRDDITDFDYKDAFNEAMAGAVGGAVMGGAGGVVDVARSNLGGAYDATKDFATNPMQAVGDGIANLGAKAGEWKAKREGEAERKTMQDSFDQKLAAQIDGLGQADVDERDLPGDLNIDGSVEADKAAGDYYKQLAAKVLSSEHRADYTNEDREAAARFASHGDWSVFRKEVKEAKKSRLEREMAKRQTDELGDALGLKKDGGSKFSMMRPTLTDDFGETEGRDMDDDTVTDDFGNVARQVVGNETYEAKDSEIGAGTRKAVALERRWGNEKVKQDAQRVVSVADVLVSQGHYPKEVVDAAKSATKRDALLTTASDLIMWAKTGFAESTPVADAIIKQHGAESALKMIESSYEAAVKAGIAPENEAKVAEVKAYIDKRRLSDKMLSDNILANINLEYAKRVKNMPELISNLREVLYRPKEGGTTKKMTGQGDLFDRSFGERSLAGSKVFDMLFPTPTQKRNVLDAFELAYGNPTGQTTDPAMRGANEPINDENMGASRTTAKLDGDGREAKYGEFGQAERGFEETNEESGNEAAPRSRSTYVKTKFAGPDGNYFKHTYDTKNPDDAAKLKSVIDQERERKGEDGSVSRIEEVGIVDRALDEAKLKANGELNETEHFAVLEALVKEHYDKVERPAAPPESASKLTHSLYKKDLARYEQRVRKAAAALNKQHRSVRRVDLAGDRLPDEIDIEAIRANERNVRLDNSANAPENGTLVFKTKGGGNFIINAPQIMRMMFKQANNFGDPGANYKGEDGAVVTGSTVNKGELFLKGIAAVLQHDKFVSAGYVKNGEVLPLDTLPDNFKIIGDMRWADYKQAVEDYRERVSAAGASKDSDPSTFDQRREPVANQDFELVAEISNRLAKLDKDDPNKAEARSFVGRWNDKKNPDYKKSFNGKRDLKRWAEFFKVPFDAHQMNDGKGADGLDGSDQHVPGLKATDIDGEMHRDGNPSKYKSVRNKKGEIVSVTVLDEGRGLLQRKDDQGFTGRSQAVDPKDAAKFEPAKSKTPNRTTRTSPDELVSEQLIEALQKGAPSTLKLINSAMLDTGNTRGLDLLAVALKRLTSMSPLGLAEAVSGGMTKARAEVILKRADTASLYLSGKVDASALKSEDGDVREGLDERGAGDSGRSNAVGQRGASEERAERNQPQDAAGTDVGQRAAAAEGVSPAKQLRDHLDANASKNAVWAGAARKALSANSEKQIAGSLAYAKKQFGELSVDAQHSDAAQGTATSGADAAWTKLSAAEQESYGVYYRDARIEEGGLKDKISKIEDAGHRDPTFLIEAKMIAHHEATKGLSHKERADYNRAKAEERLAPLREELKSAQMAIKDLIESFGKGNLEGVRKTITDKLHPASSKGSLESSSPTIHTVGAKVAEQLRGMTDAELVKFAEKQRFRAKSTADKKLRDVILGEASAAEGMLESRTKPSAQRPTAPTITQEEGAAEVHRLVGKDISVLFANSKLIGGGSGRWTPGETMNTIALAIDGDMLSAARHESLHQFFDMLGKRGDETTKAFLNRMGKNKVILNKLDRLLDGHPEAQAQVQNSPEEAMAFLFQFWTAGQIKLGPETTTLFEKIKQFIADTAKLLASKVSMEYRKQYAKEKADKADSALLENILAGLNSGQVADTTTRDAVLANLKKNVEQHELAIKKINDLYSKAYNKLGRIAFAAESMMEAAANPYLAEHSGVYHQKAGTTMRKHTSKGGVTSYGALMESVRRETDKWMNRLETSLGQMVDGKLVPYEEADLKLATKGLLTEKRPTAKAAAEIYDKVLAYYDDIFEYLDASDVRRLDMDRIDPETNTAGTWVKLDKRKKYFTHLWNTDKLLSDGDKFKATLLEKHMPELVKLAEQATKEAKDFKAYPSLDPNTAADIERRRSEQAFKDSGKAMAKVDIKDITPEQVAEAIYMRLLNSQGKVDIDTDESHLGKTPAASSINRRELSWLDKDAFAEYMSDDIVRIMTTYTSSMVKRAEHQKRFGYGGEKTDAAVDKAFLYELGGEDLVKRSADVLPLKIKAWKKAKAKAEGEFTAPYPTLRLVGYDIARAQAKSPEAFAEQLKEAADKLAPGLNALRAMEGVLGSEINPTARMLSSWATVYTQFRVLPMTLFTSFNDVLGVVINGGELKDAWGAFVSGAKEIRNSWAGNKDRSADMMRSEEWGTVDAASFLESLGQAYGSVFMNDKARRWSNKLFRANGMAGWNRGVRAYATGVAENTIMNWVNNGVNEKDAAEMARFERLYGPGVSPKDIKLDAEGGLDINDELNRAAVNRWVLDAIMTPNAAIRSTWMSDPRFQVFAMLKSFTYTFHRVMLKGIWEQAKLGNYRPALIAGLGYAPIAIAGGAIKEMLVPGEEPPWMQGGLDDYLSYGYARAGLGGIPQMYLGDVLDGDPFGVLGPFMDQLRDAALSPLPETRVNLSPFEGDSALIKDRTVIGEALGATPVAGIYLKRAYN